MPRRATLAILLQTGPRWFRRSLTLPRLKPGGCSVHRRSYRRSYRHDSPKGLPGPWDVPGRVLVSVEDAATVCADMGTHAQTLGHAHPTAIAVLAGIVRGNRDDSTPGACCLGREDGAKRRPARITDALGQVTVLMLLAR